MSLINRMLQDLDARRETHGAGANLPNDVRPLPAAPPSRLPWMLAALAGFGVAALAVYFALREPAAPVVPPAPPVATQPAPLAVRAEAGVALAPVPAEPVVPEPAGKNVPAEISAAKAEAPRESETLAAPARRADAPVEAPRNEPAKREAAALPDKAEAAPVRVEKTVETPPAENRAAKRVSIEKSEPAVPPQDRAETAYRKAIAAVDQGRPAEAQEILRDALRADGLHVAARQLLVRLLLEARQVNEAVEVLREGLHGQPAQIGWAMTLARLQVDRGDPAGAALTLQNSLPAAFGNADYLGFAGHLQQRLGNGQEAASLYQAATRLAPDDGRWWLGLGLAMEAEGRNDQALAAFQRARQCGNLSRELAALVEQKLRQQ
jgi:MSHA biogenesis protein MshN